MTQGIRVLVAEDEPTMQKMVEIVLKRMPLTFRIVANGAEALAACETEDFDVVFMDVNMPVMDGIEATRRLREREKATGRHIPVIAMTAADETECAAMAVDGCLFKPVSLDRLRDAVDRYSGRH